jgi:translation initiation factor 5B
LFPYRYATILAFDVKIERDAQELADHLGVKIFQADIIYHLFDKFMAYRDELKARKRDEFKSIAVFPCKLKVSANRFVRISNRSTQKFYPRGA